MYDNTAPKLSYVAMLSKATNYKYAKNGDTIRFLVAYSEEVKLNDDFVVVFNNTGKTINLMIADSLHSLLTSYDELQEYDFDKLEKKPYLDYVW